MNIQVVILAAGRGVRMNSNTAKVLHEVKNIALIEYVVNGVLPVCPKPTIIIGYKGKKIIERIKNQCHYVRQKEQLGTGHAVLCAKDSLINKNFDAIMVVPGDLPCVSSTTLKKLAREHIKKKAILTLSTAIVPSFEKNYQSFYDYGRIIRSQNKNIIDIVELKSAAEKQKKIKEINVGFYCFEPDWLWNNLPKLSNNNKAREYYLTDLVKIAARQDEPINSIALSNPLEGLGVNTAKQLEAVKKII